MKNDHVNAQAKKEEEKTKFPGYPKYPSADDIYKTEEKISLDDMEVIPNADSPDPETWNERQDFTGDDLDVPGSELDDPAEDVGSEDEENNYYSLGGDDHNDLEENKGE